MIGKTPYRQFLDARVKDQEAHVKEQHAKNKWQLNEQTEGKLTEEEYLKIRDEANLAIREANAELREALSEGLLDYCKEPETKPLNTEMAHYLHIALHSLVNNHDHPLFTLNRGRGDSGEDPIKHDCIADAVRYIRASRKGLIDDSNPEETVLLAFTEYAPDANLNHRTVERWLVKSDWSEVAPEDVEVDLIPDLMKYSGRFYGRHFAS